MIEFSLVVLGMAYAVAAIKQRRNGKKKEKEQDKHIAKLEKVEKLKKS